MQKNEFPNAATLMGGLIAELGIVFLFSRFDQTDDAKEYVEETRQFWYDKKIDVWSTWDDTQALVNSLCWIPNEQECIWWLTEEGQVGRTIDCDLLNYEKIEGAGVHSEGAKNWGYLNRLRYLHGTLYAIGNSGQVYRRLGTDQWEHMDEGVLQPPITVPREITKMINLNDIGGPAADDLYTCGDSKNLHHWNGAVWRRLQVPDHIVHMQEICVISAEVIYVCGYNGCLLKGNARDGFVDVSTHDINADFLSVHRFGDTLFLAAAEGLYTYDGKAIKPYSTKLKPKLQDAHQLDSADGVLWSFGYKDLAYFDGKSWTRVHHPGNPKIR
jgi:hypothetical protein